MAPRVSLRVHSLQLISNTSNEHVNSSANQMQSYLPLLVPNPSAQSLASLYRGVINLQSRYLLTSPFCNAFQPPAESHIAPAKNGAATDDTVKPTYSNQTVFECKYELDSLAAFLEVSTDYYTATKDVTFFGKYNWVAAVNAVLGVAEAMMTPTYAANGSVNVSPYTFTRMTTRGSETLNNDGIGNPVQGGTGLIRSAFRPSDDTTIYQLLIPANMMFSRYLETAGAIMACIPGQAATAQRMCNLSQSLRTAITAHGIIQDPTWGAIYAYEVDGYGSRNIMDDANIPSLLSAPLLGYLPMNDPVYQNTRRMALGSGNPYFMRGPAISAEGGPHDGPGYAWPMASIVRILTSSNDTEIFNTLKELVATTDGLGLVHESIYASNTTNWTRQW